MKKIISFAAIICLIIFTTGSMFPQSGIEKSWGGTLDVMGQKLKIIFHITKDEKGKLTASLDSPDQGAKGIPVDSVSFENGIIKIVSNSIAGVYEGKVSNDFSKIEGEWRQAGQIFPLILIPVNEVKDDKEFFSLWQGNLKVSAIELRLVVRFYKVGKDSIGAFLDSPDQGAKDIPASTVHYGDDSVYFEIKVINGHYSGKFNDDKNKIEGEWIQNGATFPLVLEKIDKVEEIKRPQEPKKPYPYNEEEITFENKEIGITLAGTFTYPKEGKNFPAVVLVSGSGPQNRDEELLSHKPFLVWSDYLTKNGIAVLRFDDRGFGKSTGNFGSAITQDFVTDALSAVNYLKGRKEVDVKKIGIIGHSEGGLIAPIAANKSNDVSFVVLAAGTSVPGNEIILLQSELISRKAGTSEEEIKKTLDITRKTYEIILNIEDSAEAVQKINVLWEEYYQALSDSEKNKPENSKEFMEQQKKTIFSPWFRYFLKFDPRTELVKLKIPVLAFFGENDLQVAPSQNKDEMEKALEKSNSKNYKVVVLPGLNHLFQESETGSPTDYAKIEQTTSPKMLELMTGWIKEVTK